MEPNPSESSDSDPEATKDIETSLENSALMQSLLGTTSPTFLDRPLADCLFSDEDVDKQSEASDAASKAPGRPAAVALSKDQQPAASKEAGEGIKLRLKLEKSETVNYVAVVNVQPAQKTSPIAEPSSAGSTSSGGSSPAEPRVPPLHISLKGRNLAVLNSPKKEVKRKKSRGRHDSGDEDEFHRGMQSLSYNNCTVFVENHNVLFVYCSTDKKSAKRKRIHALSLGDSEREDIQNDEHSNHADEPESNFVESSSKPKVKTKTPPSPPTAVPGDTDKAAPLGLVDRLENHDSSDLKCDNVQPALTGSTADVAQSDAVLAADKPREAADEGACSAMVNHKDEEVPSSPRPVEEAQCVSSEETLETQPDTSLKPKEAIESADVVPCDVTLEGEAGQEAEPSPVENSQQVPSESSRSSKPPSPVRAALPDSSTLHTRVEAVEPRVSQDNPAGESVKSPSESPAPSQLNPECDVENVFIDVKREEYFNGNSFFF